MPVAATPLGECLVQGLFHTLFPREYVHDRCHAPDHRDVIRAQGGTKHDTIMLRQNSSSERANRSANDHRT